MQQAHLSNRDTVNYGSYYTPPGIVALAYAMLRKNVSATANCTIADTSCGYGSFLQLPAPFVTAKLIGADCDKAALEQAARKTPAAKRLICHNSLYQVSRARYGLAESDRLILIGNPPYNDRTSLIRSDIKQQHCQIDADLCHRDLGISFLLSYEKLAADYICILHPLSYLIKKANFNALGKFRQHYRLQDSLIISSGEFSATSKSAQFPILIALYRRDIRGMSYEFIRNTAFTTKEGRSFCLSEFDYLSNYITKYPNHRAVSLTETAAFFRTMRDINALKRSRSFIEAENYNSIRVTRDKLAFYCYADIFKNHAARLPYYFGNSDIMIDLARFETLQEVFVSKSIQNHPFLRHLAPQKGYSNADFLIHSYFRNLLGQHYAYQPY